MENNCFVVRLLQFFILLFIPHFTFGQNAKVLVQNAKSSTPSAPLIEVKWYSSEFVYPEGCNVYRKQKGESSWIKMNSVPISITKTVPAAWAAKDEDLEALMSMVMEMTKSKNDGFVLLNIYAKSFQSAQFSKLVGIQFDDNKIVYGNTYEYRVTKIEKNKETELAISPPIKAGMYVANESVKEFTSKAEKNRVKLKWKPDESAFYGVNVYRSSKEDTIWKKINQQPIVLSETQGNTSPSDAFYADRDLPENSTYFYRISGLDFFGNETQPTEKIQIDIGDTTPPPAVENLKSKVTANMKIRISWSVNLAEDVVGYFIYRSNKSDGPYSKIGVSILSRTDSIYEDIVPSVGHYYYYVASADKAGNEKPSEKTLIEMKDIVPPATPVRVAAKSDTGKIILSWARNVEPDLMGYYVYRAIRNSGGEQFVLVNAIALKDSIYVQVLPKNASNSFFFKIVAVDTSYNRSAPSEIVAAKMPDVTPPIKPIIENIKLKNDGVQVTWKSNPENDIKGYNLFKYRTKPSERMKVNVQQFSNLSKEFTDTTLMESGKIYYQLQTMDESGNASVFSDPFPVEIQAKFDYHFLNAKAKFRRRKVTITWSGSRSTENLLGFVVFRKNGNDQLWRPVSEIQSTTVFEDKLNENSAIFFYRVKACSNFGKVVWSDIIKTK